MRIREVMHGTGLSKKSIHHYIQEGLLKPKADANGYFDFSEDDLERLILIRQLRDLDIPVKDILRILNHPETAIFILAYHRRKLRRRKELLKWQYEKISALEKKLVSVPPMTQLACIYENRQAFSFPPEDSLPIDDVDAEIIACHFWGNRMRNLELTEYRKYLYGRLQQRIITHQTKENVALRNYLCSLKPPEIVAEYFLTKDQLYEELLCLTPDRYPEYSDKIISAIAENLGKPAWIFAWKKYYHCYLYPSSVYYDDETNIQLFSEILPEYKTYQENARACCSYVFHHFNSKSGAALKDSLLKALDGYMDLNSSHHMILLGLYAFKLQKTDRRHDSSSA